MIARPPSTVPVPDAVADLAPTVDVPEPLAEPRRNWDDDPRTCARDDDRYWDDLYDRDEERA
ncbi:hypothetical protein [Streptomyces sp. NPDC060188]|uniref:hypothetical protein n=1 Tax=Streptomyces sp. NPDC060188 TaxID=3347068 RepID=UPI00365D3E90